MNGTQSPSIIPRVPPVTPRAVDRLIALRRNVASFYTQPEESVALFQQRKAALRSLIEARPPELRELCLSLLEVRGSSLWLTLAHVVIVTPYALRLMVASLTGADLSI